MNDRLRDAGLRAIRGDDPSWAARLVRLTTAVLEPGYATAMRVRNRLYDVGLKRTRDLGRPAISVGNLTTGGTGKTPVVGWLARRLAEAGRRPAVLLRGYGKADESDELRVLRRALGDDVPVHASPSRVGGAAAVLRAAPAVDVFLLDDAFQHRRAARAFDLVLISATNPFGFGHVLPRGLMREPAGGLRRASAILVTHCEAADDAALGTLEAELRRYNPTAPIHRAEHVHTSLWNPADDSETPMAALSAQPFFAVAGIGDPAALDRQLSRFADTYRGHRWFADHHAYTADDVAAIRRAAGPARLVATEKDWVKLSGVTGAQQAGWAVLQLSLRFLADADRHIVTSVLAALREV